MIRSCVKGGRHADAGVQGQTPCLRPSPDGSLPPAGSGPHAVGRLRRGGRQPDRSRRQSRRAEGAAAALRRAGEMRLYRPALQHRERGLGLQRQGERSADARMAGAERGGGRRGPGAPRQVALHDVAAPATAQGAAGGRRGDLRVDRRQRIAPFAYDDGRDFRRGQLLCRSHAKSHAHRSQLQQGFQSERGLRTCLCEDEIMVFRKQGSLHSSRYRQVRVISARRRRRAREIQTRPHSRRKLL